MIFNQFRLLTKNEWSVEVVIGPTEVVPLLQSLQIGVFQQAELIFSQFRETEDGGAGHPPEQRLLFFPVGR